MFKYKICDLPQHCSELAYFSAIKRMFPLSDWLSLASGVKNVEIDTIQHNPGFGWCSTSDELDMSRDELWSMFATELTRFSFIWGGLEGLIDDVVPIKNGKKLGKINATCEFLKNSYEPELPPVSYKNILDEFQFVLSRSMDYFSIKSDLKLRPYVGQTGIGLLVVYKIRNKFAHGSMTIPQPLDDHPNNKIEPNLIKLSSRLVLLAIQMLIWTQYKTSSEHITPFWNSTDLGDKDAEPIEIKNYLRILHVQNWFDESSKVPTNQLALFSNSQGN